ncbi:MAG: S41 family peptidase [Acidobacteria bacterium]|jgi:tricorn protease|nr:S41 family peptidase [Acidobacteriota bacterium]
MKKVLLASLALLLLAAVPAGAAEARFMTYPDIHGDRIAFVYEGNLWLAPDAGGTAQRLTSFPGTASAPKFSPDGRWIAFSADYDGPPSVYLMPAGGGEPRRLTWQPGNLQVVAWTPDGRRVVFRADTEQFIHRDPHLYSVALDGTVPERLPVDRGTLCSFSADGSRMFFTRKGNEEYQWKRYKGGQHTDIWHYDFKSRRFTPVSDYVGKNAYPMWVGDALYFVSDREGGIANIYRQDIKSKAVTPVTRHEKYDVMMPETDGERIVYVQDGRLNVLALRDGSSRPVAIELPSDRWRLRDRWVDARDYIHGMDVGNDGRFALLEARGDVFLLPTGKGPVRNLTQTPGSREIHPRLSPDGQWLAFFSDRSGEYQLYMRRVAGGDWVQLTQTLDRAVYRLAWSPDGRKILFGNKDLAVFILDIAKKQLTRIDEVNQLKNDEFTWEIDDYSWSPDSLWVCYSMVARNRNSQVFLYSLEQGKKITLTDDFYNNLNPCFDANGEYLYYLSSRNFDVRMDFYEDNHVIATPYQVMAVQLRAGQKPPFTDEEDDAPAKPSVPAVRAVPAASAPRLRIDLEGLAARTFPLPVPAGNYFFLRAGKGRVTWCSTAEFGDDEYEEIFKPRGAVKWTLHIFDMKEKKAVALEEKIGSYALSVNGEQVIISRGKEYFVSGLEKLRAEKKTAAKLSLDGMAYWVDTLAEWNQIFSDAWRWYRDFFYDASMHGQDWREVGARYRAFIPQLSSRAGLNWLLSQMVGELCVGHAYIGGGDMGGMKLAESPVFTGRLGADLAYDPAAGFFRFEKIYGPSEYNLDITAPLVRPDIALKEGDYLIAINHRPLQKNEDFHRWLQVARGQKVALTVNSRPSAEGARTYEVEPLRSDRALRYNRWLTDNIRKVLAASGGRVGYMHINAMGVGNIGEFDKFWRAFRYKEGIIIDVRRNSGGWTEYFMIDKLERRQVAFNVLRGMAPFVYPGSVGPQNYVAVSNEYNGSDGEAFIEHFQARRLGPVVGTPSWGGLVGILNGQRTVDNGSVNQPNNAFYGKAGQWWVENRGAIPDIEVENDPNLVMAGRDPQLEKAIEVVLAQIEKNKEDRLPPVPAYPDKR